MPARLWSAGVGRHALPKPPTPELRGDAPPVEPVLAAEAESSLAELAMMGNEAIRGLGEQIRRRPLPRRRAQPEHLDARSNGGRPIRWPAAGLSHRTTVTIALVGLGGAAAAIVTSLTAGFLVYPGWLAVQKAVLILGPISAGLYWSWRRPASRFGPILVGFGLLAIPYALQSVRTPLLYSIGVAWDAPFFLATIWLVLAFPSGRLDGKLERAIVSITILTLVGTFGPYLLFSPQIQGGGPISQCAAACPPNAFLIAPHLGLVSAAATIEAYLGIAIALATAGVLVLRLSKSAPPQRVARATGGAAGLAFALAYAGLHITGLMAPAGHHVHDVFQWALVGARASIAYSFLLALALAELSAGRVVRPRVGGSLARPTGSELERMVARVLHDPSVQLAAWSASRRAYVGVDGASVEEMRPGHGQTMTEVEHDGHKALAVLHSAELDDDPELIQAAGAGALLTLENRRLESALHESIEDVRRSRDRLAAASDAERRRLEQDLHDGVQQQLVALRIQLSLTADLADDRTALHTQLTKLGRDVEDAIGALRDLSHGLYPWQLADSGLVAALRAAAARSGREVSVSGEGLRRYPMRVEAAIYYCATEAIQNATKHAGPSARTTVRLEEREQRITISVVDDGDGFSLNGQPRGAGIQNMDDRMAAVGGHLEVHSQPAHGTWIDGWVPVPDTFDPPDESRRSRSEARLSH